MRIRQKKFLCYYGLVDSFYIQVGVSMFCKYKAQWCVCGRTLRSITTDPRPD